MNLGVRRGESYAQWMLRIRSLADKSVEPAKSTENPIEKSVEDPFLKHFSETPLTDPESLARFNDVFKDL